MSIDNLNIVNPNMLFQA